MKYIQYSKKYSKSVHMKHNVYTFNKGFTLLLLAL